MTRDDFRTKKQSDLEAAIISQEFEIKFLEDELGKLEDDINKTSQIIYPSVKDGRKDIAHLQQEKQAMVSIIKQQQGVYETLKAKYEFLIQSF